MPNPQLGGQFAPKVTFGGGDEAQTSAVQAQSSLNASDIDREHTFKPFINRNVPDFGRMHAQLARQLAANKEARKFQQVIFEPFLYIVHDAVVPTLAPDSKGTNTILFHHT